MFRAKSASIVKSSSTQSLKKNQDGSSVAYTKQQMSTNDQTVSVKKNSQYSSDKNTNFKSSLMSIQSNNLETPAPNTMKRHQKSLSFSTNNKKLREEVIQQNKVDKIKNIFNEYMKTDSIYDLNEDAIEEEDDSNYQTFKSAFMGNCYKDGKLITNFKEEQQQTKKQNFKFQFAMSLVNTKQIDTDKKFIQKVKTRQRSINSKDFVRKMMNDLNIELNSKKNKRNNKLKIIQNIRDNTLNQLQNQIKYKEKNEILNHAKQHLIESTDKMQQEVKEIILENNSLKSLNIEINIKNSELQIDIMNLQKRNKIQLEMINKLQSQNEYLNVKNNQLEVYKKGLELFQQKFPDPVFTLEILMQRYEILENDGLGLTKTMIDLQYDKDAYKKKTDQQIRNYQQQELILLNQAQEELIQKTKQYQSKIINYEKTISNLKHFKQDYQQIFNKIISIFNQWNTKQRVYHNPQQNLPYKPNLDDPLSVLGVMEKMIIISTDSGLQDYLKKIISCAYKITKKYFINHINDTYDPDVVYERILNLVEQKDKIIESLKYQLGKIQLKK